MREVELDCQDWREGKEERRLRGQRSELQKKQSKKTELCELLSCDETPVSQADRCTRCSLHAAQASADAVKLPCWMSSLQLQRSCCACVRGRCCSSQRSTRSTKADRRVRQILWSWMDTGASKAHAGSTAACRWRTAGERICCCGREARMQKQGRSWRCRWSSGRSWMVLERWLWRARTRSTNRDDVSIQHGPRMCSRSSADATAPV